MEIDPSILPSSKHSLFCQFSSTRWILTVTGLIYPAVEAVREVESILREELEEPDLELIIRFTKYDLLNREGVRRAELTGFFELTSELRAPVETITSSLENWFADDVDFSLVSTDYTLIGEEFYFYLDVAGPHFFPIEKVQELQTLTTQKSGQKVNVFVISSGETVATTEGHESYVNFSHRIVEKLEPTIREELNKLIEQSNL